VVVEAAGDLEEVHRTRAGQDLRKKTDETLWSVTLEDWEGQSGEDFYSEDAESKSVENWDEDGGDGDAPEDNSEYPDNSQDYSENYSGYSEDDLADTVEDFGESLRMPKENWRSSGGFSPHLGDLAPSTTQSNPPSSSLESETKPQLETLLGAALGTLTVFLVLLLLFLLCRRTRSKGKPEAARGPDAPEVAVVINFPTGPPSNPPPPPPNHPPPNLPCLAPLAQPQPAWLEEIQRNLRFQQQELKEEELANQESDKESEFSSGCSDTGVESLHGTFGREHKYGKQHHLAHGAPPPGPEITTVGEHLVGEAATLGLQPGQELRVLRRETEGWVKLRRLACNLARS